MRMCFGHGVGDAGDKAMALPPRHRISCTELLLEDSSSL